MGQVDFSVAIRTFNGARRLPRLLEALRSQIMTVPLAWEIVVIDNNSQDGTAALVAQLSPTLPVPLRCVLEPRQGAVFARQRAIAEARGELIGFLDDDNVPAPNWVSTAAAFGAAHPQAAAFGGQIHGRFEVPPPPRFERIAAFLPVIERDLDMCFTTGKWRWFNLVPPGAGLVVRRQAWLQHVPSQLRLKGPVGSSLAEKGEDVEALLHLKKAGWEIWFHTQLHIDHWIGRERFDRRYLLAFFRGIGYSRYTTRTAICQPAMRLPLTLLHAVNDGRKLLWHWLKYPGDRDLVVACERALLSSSLLSALRRIWGKVSTGKSARAQAKAVQTRTVSVESKR